MSDYINQNSNIMSFDTIDNWILLNSLEYSIKCKIEKYGIPLSDWNISINYGIKTGYNDAFIIDKTTKDTLISSDPKTVELIRPILRGKDIKKYTYNYANKYIIAIPCGFTNKHNFDSPVNWFIDNYPTLYEYFVSTEEELSKNRSSKSKGLYKRDDQGEYWWELRSCKYMDDFNKQKIIYPCIMSKEPCFMFDTKGEYYTIAPGNIITGKNIDYVFAYLTSKTYYFALRKFYMGGGIEGELKTNRLLILPIPLVTKNKNCDSIFTTIHSIINKYEIEKKLDKQLYSNLNDLINESIELTEEEIDYINNYHY